MEHFIETVRRYPCLWNTTAIEYRDQELKDAAWAEVMKETDLSSVKEVKLKWKNLRDSYRDALKRKNEMLAKDPSNTGKKVYHWKYMGLMQFLQPYMGNRRKPAESPSDAPPPGPSAAVASAAGAANGHARYAAAANGHAHKGATTDAAAAGDSRSSDETDSEPEITPKRKGCEQLNASDRKLDYIFKSQNKRQFTEAHFQERRCEAYAVPLPDPLDIFFNSMCQSTKRLPFQMQIKIKKTLFNAVIEAEQALLAEQQSYASLWAAAGGSSSGSDGDAPREDRPA